MVVATSDKQRFALSPDGTRIRANQGHSVDIELGLAPATPPDRLYHGTVARFVDGIRELGLLKGSAITCTCPPTTTPPTRSADGAARRSCSSCARPRWPRPATCSFARRTACGSSSTCRRRSSSFPIARAAPARATARRRCAIAKATLAACEAGRYTNARGERVGYLAIRRGRDGTAPRTPPASSGAAHTTRISGDRRANDDRRDAAGSGDGCQSRSTSPRPRTPAAASSAARRRRRSRSRDRARCIRACARARGVLRRQPRRTARRSISTSRCTRRTCRSSATTTVAGSTRPCSPR